MSKLAIDLKNDKIPVLVEILSEAFRNPKRVLTVEQWQAGDSVGSVAAEIYGNADDSQKTRIGQAAADLLSEWIATVPQQASALRQLLLFLAISKPEEARLILEALIDNHVGLKHSPEWHARLLSLLQDYQTRQDCDRRRGIGFWRDEYEKHLKGQYPAVIWAGMLQADVSEAFRNLPRLATTKRNAESVTDVFAWTSARVVGGDENLRERLLEVGDDLGNKIKDVFNEWFIAHRRYPPWLERLTGVDVDDVETLLGRCDESELRALHNTASKGDTEKLKKIAFRVQLKLDFLEFSKNRRSAVYPERIKA